MEYISDYLPCDEIIIRASENNSEKGDSEFPEIYLP
jgi:hypothetical protein|uniref:Uncharacterized protein n=1 Tax=Myoviridae sp. ctByu2 TaxID=2827668 RepID=A0A8S5S9S6_9CAUD|nr:MAG TPA: hypothetical protein [Myoviridae sp. ctByu2]